MNPHLKPKLSIFSKIYIKDHIKPKHLNTLLLLLANNNLFGGYDNMKKTLTLTVLLGFLAALMASFAGALTVSDVSIGGSNQDRTANVQSTFMITNDDTTSVTVNAPTHTADNSKYNIRFTGQTFPLTIPASESRQVTITADIPLDFDAVDSNTLKEKAFVIGQLTVSTTGGVSDTADISMQAKNQLEIKDINVDCDGITESVDDGDEVENLRPDMSCSVEVEVENNFRENDVSGQRIGDVEFDTITIEITSDEDDLDCKDDDDVDGLDADDEDTVTLECEIEEDADDGKASVDVRASGFDENGALHGEEINFKLEVDRKKHDLLFKSATLSPNTVDSCTGGNVRVSANMQNLGQRDERDAKVKASIAGLGLSDETAEMEIDEDSSRTVTLNLQLAPETKAGVYSVLLESFYETSVFSNSEALDLVVEKCEAAEDMEEEEETEEKETTITVTPATTTTTPTSTETAAETATAAPRTRVRSSFRDTGAYIGLLIGLGILLLIIIIVLLAIFTRRKPMMGK